MSTRRAIETDDEEKSAVARGDIQGALEAQRKAYQRAHVTSEESSAMYKFLVAHKAEVLSCDANISILMKEAKSYGAVVNLDLIELAYLKVKDSLVAPAPPVREPSAEENRVANNQKLCAMNSDELRKEIQRKMPHLKIMTDSLEPQCSAIKTRADIKALSGEAMRKLMWKSGGEKKTLNTQHLQNILNGSL